MNTLLINHRSVATIENRTSTIKNARNVSLLNVRSMKTVNGKVNKIAEIQTLIELNKCIILCVRDMVRY